MQDTVSEFRHLGQFRLPGRGEGGTVGLKPMGLAHRPHRNVHRLHGPDQPHTPFDLTVIQHDAGGRDLHGGTTGALVDEQFGTRIIQFRQGGIERDRLIALALGERQEPGFRPCARMDVDHLPVCDDEAFGLQRFQPHVIGAGCNRPVDPRLQKLLEGREQDALQLDGQRQ